MKARSIIVPLATVAIVSIAAALFYFGQNGGFASRGPQAAVHREVAYKTTPKSITDFTLLDHEGTIQMLYRNWDAKAVVFIGQENGCPIVQKYSSRIREMNKKYEAQGIRFFMINPNPTDDRSSIIKEADDYNFGIPILLDPSQIVTRELGLTRSSEVVMLSTENWEVIYRGPIDDQVGFEVNKQTARSTPLEHALDDVVANRPVSQASMSAKGCAFTFEKPAMLSFEKTIGPLIVDKCLNCHSSKGTFPPALDNYDKIRSWSAMIRESLFTDRMPPFSADSHYGKYKNDISLSPKEKALFVAWIDQGMHKDSDGNPEIQIDWSKNKHALAFQLKQTPIYTASMNEEFNVPPEGTVEYQYFQLGGPAPRDMWVTAFHTTSTNPRQLHHESLMVIGKPLAYFESLAAPNRDEDLAKNNVDGDIPIYTLKEIMKYGSRDENFVRFQVWASGRPKVTFANKGTAYFIPKGYFLILEAHYMGTGKPEKERTTIDFYGKPAADGLKQVHVTMLRQLTLEIPAGAKRHVVATPLWPVRKDIELIGMMGHLHMRGRATRLIERKSDGSKKILSSIPNYYYAWQVGAGISPETPIPVAKDSDLYCECEFDNSPQNPNNPDPGKDVHFGQTVDKSEMCLFHLAYIYAH